MSASRKDFEAIAAILKLQAPEGRTIEPIVLWIANDLADYFTEQNPSFDRECFLAACGKR